MNLRWVYCITYPSTYMLREWIYHNSDTSMAKITTIPGVTLRELGSQIVAGVGRFSYSRVLFGTTKSSDYITGKRRKSPGLVDFVQNTFEQES